MKHKIIVEKIIKYVNKIMRYTEDSTYESFAKNTVLVEACVFNLSQIGELANKIDSEFERLNDDIPWRELYDLRNRIVHDHDEVNLVLIWDIIKNVLPGLLIKLN